jgi:2-polyprenyl-3-methyl-5-hydroxy-6-metoxy-1,4-benzoquinol methylase
LEEPSDTRCPVCDAQDPRLRYEITRFSVNECRDCTQIYLWPQLTDEEVREMFSTLYTVGEGSVPELKSYYEFTYDDVPDNPLVQLYERWLDALEIHRKGGRLLDIGCGTGLFLAVARRRGWEPFGIDDCAEATQHAREHFGLDVSNGEFADFARTDARFDVITMWDIIEHARRPVDLLASAAQCLAADGVIGISTPNQRSILDVVAGGIYHASGGRLTRALEKFYIEQHFLYFTPTTLAAAIDRAGLEVAVMKRELTDLRRLTLAPPMRLVLQILFGCARLTGLENRLFAIARTAGATGSVASERSAGSGASP